MSEGKDPRKIFVVHNGIDVSAYEQDFRKQVAAIKSKYSVPEDALVVGITANYHRAVKGISYFIEAAKIVTSHIDNLFFFVIGYGRPEQESALRRRVRELGLDPYFVFTGLQQDVRPFLSMLDVAVLTSLSEGFSNSLLEYMAAGLPAVVTNVGGNREAVVDGQSGFLVEPASAHALADKIVVLLKDAQLREKIGRAARDRVKNHFSMEKAVRETERLYRDLCSSKSHPKKPPGDTLFRRYRLQDPAREDTAT